ncbi:MAG: signal peptidase II [Bacilli bacterium]
MHNKLEALRAKLDVDKRRFIVVCICVLMFIPLLALDLVTKIIFEKILTERGTIVVIKNFFHFELVYNKGCFAGLGADSIPAHIILILVSLAGAIVIPYLFIRKYKTWNNWILIGLGLMLPGDVGNLVDRCIFDENGFRGVIDFFYFNLGFMEWPTFNVADALLVIGIGCVVVGYILDERKSSLQKDDKVQEILAQEENDKEND